MSRRARALAFLLVALLSAAAAAAIARGYGSRLTEGYGPLRSVVVIGGPLPPGKRLGPEEIAEALAVRRVPERFVPADALVSSAEALGLAPAGRLPVGSYLVASQLRAPRADAGAQRPRFGAGRSPVEIAVSGADALLLARPRPEGASVDVIVTSEPTVDGRGRTYVAARRVPLLALSPGIDGHEPGGTAAATLGLTRRQALRLIAAESVARKLTLIVSG